jgi:hypothetical protein
VQLKQGCLHPSLAVSVGLILYSKERLKIGAGQNPKIIKLYCCIFNIEWLAIG